MTQTEARTEAIRKIIGKGSRYVTITFRKKDGAIRNLTVNPAQHLVTKGTGSPRPADCFTFVDTHKHAWRSFRAHQVLSIQANGKTHEFEDEELFV